MSLEIQSLALARVAIREMKPYVSARSLALDGDVFLDANENPESVLAPFERYPEPQPRFLKNYFSKLYSVDPSQIMIGRGSDEAIDCLTRVFCEAGADSILIFPPTYGVYEIAAQIQGARVERMALDENFALPLALIKTRLTSGTAPKLIYLCRPNNPTGNSFALEHIEEVLRYALGRSLVIVDEAYIEYSEQESASTLLSKYESLVVLRTLSKAWGLAGVRCGVALAHPQITDLLQRVRAPYPIPAPVVEALEKVLDSRSLERVSQSVVERRRERERLSRELRAHASVVEVYPSQANFLLVRFKDARAVMNAARSHGIILRDRSSEVPGAIRISIGSYDENCKLLAVLREVSV